MASVPRLFNRFHDGIQLSLNKLTGIKSYLLNKAINTKLNNLHTQCAYTHNIYDQLIFNKIRESFGGRIRFMITGSAPISTTLMDFLKITFCCPIIEGYG